jgi:maltose O-acetyltransferase
MGDDSRADAAAFAARFRRAVAGELNGFHWRLLAVRALAAPLPAGAGARLRPALLRLAGYRIGRGTVILGMPSISGPRGSERNLEIGEGCMINVRCVFETGAPISIAAGVALGHEVMILTTTHEIGPPGRRWAAFRRLPVRVGAGSWLGARAVLLPGVEVGKGAVVGAGAVVTKHVAPNTAVAGAPARVIRALDQD